MSYFAKCFAALMTIALLAASAEAKTKKEKPTETQSSGLVVRSESATSLAVKDVATRLGDIKKRSAQAHSRLLALQDSLAQDSQDTATLEIGLSAQSDSTQYKVLDAEFYLNQILIVNYTQPVTFDESKTSLPVFSGTLPFGEYELTAKVTTGLLPYDSVFKIAQGQWLAEKTFKFQIGKDGRLSKAVVLKKTPEGPQLELRDLPQDGQ